MCTFLKRVTTLHRQLNTNYLSGVSYGKSPLFLFIEPRLSDLNIDLTLKVSK